MRDLFRVVLAFLGASLMAQNPLAPEEQRGRQIFELGTSPSGSTIEALAAGDVRVAGSIMPCANCHGHCGEGKPEGGVVPSNITWDALTKPYGLVHPDGRAHPPYTERLLKRAISMGIDPAGNALSDAMPRFQLSLADVSDLMAYIKRLGEAVDPGLTAATVRLGVILPPPSQTPADGRIVSQALLNYFAALNAAGGIFRRRVELVFTELPLNPARRAGAVHDFLSKQQIFALVGANLAGAESQIAAVISNTGTPAVAAFAPFPQVASPLNKYVFYLDGGVREELEALLSFAADRFPGKDLDATIASSDEETARETSRWLQERLAETGYRQVDVSEDGQSIRSGLVFWLRSDLESIPTDGKAVLLIPGSLLAAAHSTFPTLGSVMVYMALGTASLAEEATSERVTGERAVASAEILAEAMSRAGRDLTRATLLQALEGFYNVQTNLPAQVSFGPNRRIGASNVRIITLDPESRKFIPAQSEGGRVK
jgi:hypothetical protein